MKTDTVFYQLLSRWPALVFELAGWLPPPVEYRFMAPEVKELALRFDGVLLPPDHRLDLWTIFVEVQFQLDRLFYGRWFAEIFTYLYQHKEQREWRAVVIFPSRTVDPEPSPAYRALLESGWVQRVYLEDFKDQPAGSTAMQLVQVVIAEPNKAATQARNLLLEQQRQVDPAEFRNLLDLVERILAYKLSGKSPEEIQAMLHIPDIELEETRFYKDVFARGEVKGQVEGETKGLEKGEHREAAKLVLRQLQRRFGPLASEQQARIQSLPVAALEMLGEELLDFNASADLAAWLKQWETANP